MSRLNADYGMWAGTWDPHEGGPAFLDPDDRPIPYFNRRTGEIVWDQSAQGINGTEGDVAEAMSWPEADREVVPVLRDQAHAAAWLAERGFAVKWT